MSGNFKFFRTEKVIAVSKRAHMFLKSSSLSNNILEDIKNIIHTWSYVSDCNLHAIRKDFDDIIAKVIAEHFEGKEDIETCQAVHCIVFNELYENLIPLIRGNFLKEDLYLYEKCQLFCKKNVTPGDFGSNLYSSVPFTAAVVELSVLDLYKSPVEKINCLCSTYDLIFADIKFALVSLISKYSEKECEIPVIDNEEVMPILMFVVVKSKLLYLLSSLYYVQFFAEKILEGNCHIRTILDVFEAVVGKLMAMEESSLVSTCDQLSANLDICKTMAMLTAVENNEIDENIPATLEDEEKRRLVALIMSSTDEDDFIPLQLPKIFN